jgi:hypothetical protein
VGVTFLSLDNGQTLFGTGLLGFCDSDKSLAFIDRSIYFGLALEAKARKAQLNEEAATKN